MQTPAKSSTIPSWVNCFIFSGGLILVVTGSAKVWTSFSHTKFLAVLDPVTSISFGHLMMTVGLFELVVAGICIFSHARRLSLALIAWLATSFLIYRPGFGWMGWHRPCGCMGNLTDALHIPPQTADTAMKIVLGYLLVGSYATLFWLWRQKRAVSDVPGAAIKASPSAS